MQLVHTFFLLKTAIHINISCIATNLHKSLLQLHLFFIKLELIYVVQLLTTRVKTIVKRDYYDLCHPPISTIIDMIHYIYIYSSTSSNKLIVTKRIIGSNEFNTVQAIGTSLYEKLKCLCWGIIFKHMRSPHNDP